MYMINTRKFLADLNTEREMYKETLERLSNKFLNRKLTFEELDNLVENTIYSFREIERTFNVELNYKIKEE